MHYTRIAIACLVSGIVSAVAIAVLLRLAEPLGLMDHPNDRKHHAGQVPLVGGLAMLAGVLIGACVYARFHTFITLLLATGVVMTLVGSLDDRFNLSVRIRLLIQTICVLVMVASTGVYVHTLGHAFGYTLNLGWTGIPLTVVAVIGLLNAFNMMDGIDGLAGSLSLISIAAIILFSGATPVTGSIALLLVLATAMLPYLAANLGFTKRKIFMGDAGSMLLGYVLAWILIHLSQLPRTHLSPVDVLWCVALPVLDTLAVMYRRLRQGKSPFKPDRGHIHHILLRAGLGPRATLIALISFAAALAFTGTVARSLGNRAGLNLVVFGIVAVVYIRMVTRVWARQEQRIITSQASNVVALATAAVDRSVQKSSFEESRGAERLEAGQSHN